MISVRVKTNARRNEVQRVSDKEFIVSVSVPPVEGRANERLIELLAGFFDKPKRDIRIVHGHGTRNKRVEIF